nr:immunoglobulin heavy chain junction region [Macaca mulatta]
CARDAEYCGATYCSYGVFDFW